MYATLPDSGHTETAALRGSADALVVDAQDYAQQTIDLYKSVAGVDKVKPAQTPFLVDGTFSQADEGTPGDLAPKACSLPTYGSPRCSETLPPDRRSRWLKKIGRPLGFLQGAALTCCVRHCFRRVLASAPFLCSHRSFDCHRAVPYAFATGTRPSDSRRAFARVDRAARDLAYFFHNIPFDRISWAISYLPGGLANSL